MNTIINSDIYKFELEQLAKELPVKTGNFLITGASGLIGSCIVDVLWISNMKLGTNFKIYALGRSKEKLIQRFPYVKENIEFIEQDIVEPISDPPHLNYIIHAASYADPGSYAAYPAETILINLEGAKNVLNYCKLHPATRVLLTSTFEVYGKHEKDEYKESDYGVLDHNLMRSCYPESKRTAELLFKSYHQEYKVDSVIARLSSIYGPTMLKTDDKAHAQFIKNGLSGKNIVLKSSGTQKRTYCYVMDAVSGLFKVLFCGHSGETYNVANKNSVATIAEVAKKIAEICNTNIIFESPSDMERRKFSKQQNCILKTEKLESLGWSGKYDLYTGLKNTLNILKETDINE